MVGTSTNGGIIKKSLFDGRVKATGYEAGGLVGNGASMKYENSYTKGEIDCVSDWYTGGIAGCWQYGEMVNCYTTMYKASNTSSYLKLFAYINYYTAPTNCFSLLDNSELMKTQSTYTDAGWNFDTIWEMDSETGYPRLQWEKNIR